MSPRPRFLKLEKDRQTSILDAAAQEFAQFGFEKASLNKIIERAGISKGATYYYFDDKADLFSAVTDRLLVIFDKEAKIEQFGESGDFWGDIEDFSVDALKLMRKVPWAKGLLRAVVNYAHTHAGSAVTKRTMDIGRRFSRKFIERGQALGAIRTDLPTELMIELLIAIDLVVDSWSLEHKNLEEDEDIEDWSRKLVDLFRRLLEPREET